MDSKDGAAADAGETPTELARVVLCGELRAGDLERLYGGLALEVVWIGDGEAIPGSHWGEPEAGIVGSVVYVRRDTPVHSALHEAAHLVCMGPARRACVDTDAGGDELEESAVCYLQIVLADKLHGVGSSRLMRDMDAWGYSFRLGSTERWFLEDAEDARAWLIDRGLLDESSTHTCPGRQQLRL